MPKTTAVYFISTFLLLLTYGFQENSDGSKVDNHNVRNRRKNLFQTTLETENVGTFKYQDGQVILSHNQQKPTHFFFTPFPHIDPNRTECYYNDLSDHHELTLTVSLYTSHLLKSIERHLKQHQIICRQEHCHASLLPLHSIRLFQKGRRTVDSQKKYTLDTEWHTNKQLRQSIQFVIYTLNMSLCENLKDLIVSRCHLSSLEIHYRLHGQQTVARKIEITTEHITGTAMYNQIRSQFPSDQQDTVALTGSDYRKLLAEIIDEIILNLKVDEEYEGLQDPVAMNRIVEDQLKSKHVQLKVINNQLWNSLYWPFDLTRPDRLSRVLNQFLKQDSTDINKFYYDYSQVSEDLKRQLQASEKQKLNNLQKYLAMLSQNAENSNDHDFFNMFSAKTNTTNLLGDDSVHREPNSTRSNSTPIRTMQRKDLEKLVNYFSEHVQLQGNSITPKPIDVKLIKLESLTPNTKLFSDSILVKTRTNIHVLPLRCPNEDHQSTVSMGPLDEDKYDEPSTGINNITSIVNALDEQMIDLNQTIIQLAGIVYTFSQMMNLRINTSETHLNQKLNDKFTRMEKLMRSMETRLMKKIQNNKITNDSNIDLMENQNSTGIITNKISPVYMFLLRNVTSNTFVLSIASFLVPNKWKQHGTTVAGGNGRGDLLNQLDRPQGIFVDDDKTVYIADDPNHRIVRWTHHADEGEIIVGANGTGNGIDQLYGPVNVIIDKRNNDLIISDLGNQRVLRWSSQNQRKSQILISDVYAYNVAMDRDGSIYVCDYINSEVRRWKEGEKQGQIVAGGNGKGDNLDQLNYPTYIFIDDDYSLYVSDRANHRVMKWVKDAVEGVVAAGGNGPGSSLSQLYYPGGVIVDSFGRIYVADTHNDRVIRWNEGGTEGEIVVGGNGEGKRADQFDKPTGLSFDAEGDLYVADWGNDRVQKFEKDID